MSSSAEAGPPSVERCILRAGSREDFQAVMRKPIGAFSLQGALAEVHAQLHLGQHIPGTSQYPALTVVDLTPATTCVLDGTAAATFIVLPPHRPSAPVRNGERDVAASEAERLSEWATAAVRVSVDDCLPDGHAAEATPGLLAELLAPAHALLRVGDEEGGCTFTVRAASTAEEDRSLSADDSALSLRVAPMLFRNIRAAYAKRRLFTFQRAQVVNFTVSAFDLPLDYLEVVEDSKGDVVVHAPRVERLLLCPAVDDFSLTNVYGDEYAGLLTVCLSAAAEHMNGWFVSQGDVVCLPVRASDLHSGAKGVADGVDVAEAFLTHVGHRVEMGDTLWSSECGRTAPELLTLFRVVDVRVAGGKLGEVSGCGVLQFDPAHGSTETELALVSQQRAPWADPTPLLPPPPSPSPRVVGNAFAAPAAGVADPSPVPETGVQALLRGALAGCAVPGESCCCGGTLVVHGVADNFVSVFAQWAVRLAGLLPLVVAADAMDDADELRRLLEHFATTSQGVALVLRNAQALAEAHPELLPLVGSISTAPGMRLFVLICETVDPVVPAMAARATNVEGVLECGNPSESDRARILRYCLEHSALSDNFLLSMLLSFEDLASWTVGLSVADLVAFARDCAVAATRVSYAGTIRSVLSEQVCGSVLQRYLKDHGHNLVSTKLTPVRWSDVGGLEEAKRELKETIQLPLLHPEMFTKGMKKRTGILFYGPPGCGKTLLAKAVATEMNMNFLSVKGPELINSYVGESERNIRLLFQRARDNSPCIVFFDELDALAPARGAKGDAGGAMDRIVSQLLVEVDGVGQSRSDGSDSGDVFIIGATNRPDLLDPSLLRPGRFDRLCYLGIPSTREEQMFALQALTRKFDLAPDVDLAALLEPLDFVYTGADFFALCSDAMMFSVEDALDVARLDMERAAAAQKEGGGANEPGSEEDGEKGADEATPPIKVTMAHLIRARDQLKPSVTKDDLKKYEALKAKFNK